MRKKEHTLRKLGLSRRGIMAMYFLTWMIRFIFLVIVLIVCVMLMNMFLNNRFNTQDVQAEVLMNGMIYGPGGIGYVDPLTSRMYPEIVDVSQLDSAELDYAFYFPNNNLITAKVDLRKQDNPDPVKTVYYNKVWWDNWKPLLALKGLKGIGGVTDYTKTIPVIVREENGNLSSGYVDFQFVQPKGARVKN
ncbi:hypothetical protein KY363_04060 [Candidatus Woesearchaeota archaeon]|nr:hypothetical protein [Candidatus Woesearchaeota archaeon]